MPTQTEMLTRAQADEMIKKAIAEALNKKEPMNEEEIIAALKELPSQTERKFEKAIVTHAMKWEDEVFYIRHEDENGKVTYTDGILFNIINLIQKADATQEERQLAFYAFCVAENYARRSENRTDLEALKEQYEKYFLDQPFTLHLNVCLQIKALEAYTSDNKDNFNFDTLVADARKNMEQLTGNIGAAHAFAETVLLVFENAPELMSHLTDRKREKLLQEALDTMVVVTSVDPYAKFYCTHARLFAIAGKYEEALEHLNIAIDREDNTKSDYPIRVGRYLTYIQHIRAQQNAESNKKVADEQLKNVIKTLEDQTRDSNTKSMEFLGLFSGIVSFTIGSISISGQIEKFSANQVAGLIVVLMGALMGVFAGFGIILHGTDVRRWNNFKGFRNLIVLILGALIVMGGLYICSR